APAGVARCRGGRSRGEPGAVLGDGDGPGYEPGTPRRRLRGALGEEGETRRPARPGGAGGRRRPGAGASRRPGGGSLGRGRGGGPSASRGIRTRGSSSATRWSAPC